MPHIPKGRRWRLAFLGVVLGLLAAEVGIRLVQPLPTPTAERRKSWRYQAALQARQVFPRLSQQHERPPQRINARGYRGREFAVPKPAGVWRVIVVGGSSTFDIGSDDGADWPSQVEGRLRAMGHTEVEVINAGTPGNATWDMVGRVLAEIWMFEPDVLVVYEAWNDIKSFRTLGPEHSLLRSLAPARFIRADGILMNWNPFIEYYGRVDRALCHSQVYLALRTSYFRWRLGRIGREGRIGDDAPAESYPPWGPRQYELDLRLLVTAARTVGAVPVLLTQARLVAPDNDEESRRLIEYSSVGLSHAALVDAFAACDAAVLRVAASERVPSLDLSATLSGRRELFDDHVHTTAAGSAALAEAVAGVLAPLVPEGPTR